MTGRCLTSSRMLSAALGLNRGGLGEAERRHLEACRDCRAEAERLARLLRAGAATAGTVGAGGPCLDEIRLAAIADGAMRGTGLEEALAHLGGCPRCRRELGAVLTLVEEPEVRSAIARVVPTARRRVWVVAGSAVGMAAAAALVLLVPRDVPQTMTHRDVPETTTAVGASPVGEVTALTAFRWPPVPGADRYEVVLFAQDGAVLWEGVSAEAFVIPPDSVASTAGQSYYWLVRARVGYEQWTESPLYRFRVREP